MIVHRPDEPLMVPTQLVNDKNLSIGARFLWIVLWDSQDEKLDFEKYAKIIKRSPDTTRKYFKELVNAGYIKRDENRYTIPFDKE
jgi:Fic family protein